jgi:hypothetical protein
LTAFLFSGYFQKCCLSFETCLDIINTVPAEFPTSLSQHQSYL